MWGNTLAHSGHPMASPSRSRSVEPDRFEFFFGHLPPTGMCTAEEVFLHGKILPFRPPPPPPPKKTQTHVPKPLHEATEATATFTTQYRRLRRSPSPPQQRPRPRWSLLPFGPIQSPAAAAMGVRYLKSRQVRRRSPVAETEPEAAGWKVLRSLSCRAVESAAVAVPVASVSHAHGA